MHSLIPISVDDVLLERLPGHAPAFHAQVHLAVSGADIHAASCDHTVEAVWLKITKNLRQQIERRKGRQQSNQKINRQIPQTTSRRSGTPLAARV